MDFPKPWTACCLCEWMKVFVAHSGPATESYWVLTCCSVEILIWPYGKIKHWGSCTLSARSIQWWIYSQLPEPRDSFKFLRVTAKLTPDCFSPQRDSLCLAGVLHTAKLTQQVPLPLQVVSKWPGSLSQLSSEPSRMIRSLPCFIRGMEGRTFWKVICSFWHIPKLGVQTLFKIAFRQLCWWLVPKVRDEIIIFLNWQKTNSWLANRLPTYWDPRLQIGL